MGMTLEGLQVIELAGMGPAPHAAMLLADLGAEVIRIDRPGTTTSDPRTAVLGRSRKSIEVDLKDPAGLEVVLDLVERADVLLEGFRPGVTDRLGLGPDACHARNHRLVYGRMTGWGQSGPYAQMAGHDLTYLAVTGALHAIGRSDSPAVPPLNLVGDFGGGSTYLVIGVLAALLERERSGAGQVIDASVVDGTQSLLGLMRGLLADGEWIDERQANMLDGGAPYYAVYRCADGKEVAVAAIEQRFWDVLLEKLGWTGDPILALRDDRGSWPRVRSRLEELFATRSRDEWGALTDGTDACLAPVLSLEEATSDKHNVARAAFADVEGVPHPAPAPRFSRSATRVPHRAPLIGEHTEKVLRAGGSHQV